MSQDKIDPKGTPISAEALRMSILRKEMDKMDVETKARAAEQKRSWPTSPPTSSRIT